eukprot:UN32282
MDRPGLKKRASLFRTGTDSEWKDDELSTLEDEMKQQMEHLKMKQAESEKSNSTPASAFHGDTQDDSGQNDNSDNLETIETEDVGNSTPKRPVTPLTPLKLTEVTSVSMSL